MTRLHHALSADGIKSMPGLIGKSFPDIYENSREVHDISS
jgi:hypothetical protein